MTDKPRMKTLTLKQLMDIVQYRSRAAILEAMNAGKIPMGKKIGGEWRWSEQVIRDWISDGMPSYEVETAGEDSNG